jgi:putative ATP-dependent DNA ligase
MDLKLVREALKRGKAQRMKEALDYIRFREDFRSVERGTVIVKKKIVWGFPQIKRVFTLEKGLERNLPPCVVYAEEKIDGFNVRVANIKGKIFAFSRGGFLDAFVTEKARDMGLEKLFKEHPDYVLCGEMLGNTPYTEPTKEFDVRLYVFDIDGGNGVYLSCDEKYKLLKRHGIEHPPVFGKFNSDDYDALKKLILSLNKGKREGMVLKSLDRKHLVKYVTPYSDIQDISGASAEFFDMPIGFFYQRVLRSAFFVDDFELDKEKYASKLGKAFYNGLMRSVKKAKKGQEIIGEFEILVRDRKVWDEIRKHMSKEVRIEELYRRQEGKRTRIRFQKVYRRTSKKLISYAAGKGLAD